ncbi:MAG: RibD family protein, partial [Myxococcota bacterium]
PHAAIDKRAAFAAQGVRTIAGVSEDHVDLAEALGALQRELGLTSLLCEPGPRLLGALLQQNLVDELWWFTAPALLGDDARAAAPALGIEAMSQVLRLASSTSVRNAGADALFVGPLALRD